MFKCGAALVIALAVVAVGGLVRLPLLPLRAIRGLIRHNATRAQITAQ